MEEKVDNEKEVKNNDHKRQPNRPNYIFLR